MTPPRDGVFARLLERCTPHTSNAIAFGRSRRCFGLIGFVGMTQDRSLRRAQLTEMEGRLQRCAIVARQQQVAFEQRRQSVTPDGLLWHSHLQDPTRCSSFCERSRRRGR